MFSIDNIYTESIGCNETENIKPRRVPVKHKNRGIANCNKAGTTVFGFFSKANFQAFRENVAYTCTSAKHMLLLLIHMREALSAYSYL